MPRRLPPLNALRAFEAAARHQSMVAAAAELGVTPAAVSEQVRGLETRLRTPLFQRGARGIVLTEEGRAFLPGLSDGFDRLAWASEAIHERRVRGRVGISLLPALAAGWLVPRLPDLRRALPGVDLLIRTERRLIDFAREEVDLAIRFGPGPFRGLEARRLMYEDVFPVCAPALAHGPRAPKVLGDLAEPGVALLHDIDAHPQQTWMDWRGWFRRAGLPESAAARGL